MQVTLEVNNSEAAARIVKARLERTTLGQVAKRIRATLRPVSSLAVRPCHLATLSKPSCNAPCAVSDDGMQLHRQRGSCQGEMKPLAAFCVALAHDCNVSSPSSHRTFHGFLLRVALGLAANFAHIGSGVEAYPRH
jgi:hypothetical protein